MSASYPDIAAFRQSLLETMAWCSSRASVTDPRRSLRSEELRPPGWVNDFYEKGLAQVHGYGSHNLYDEARRQSMVESVVTARSMFVRASDAQPASARVDSRTGRLLVCYPDESVIDCASEHSSLGYFDSDDVPPWDTWVAYVREAPRVVGSAHTHIAHYVISWVPPELLQLAHQGIDVNPVNCIAWARKGGEPFLSVLERDGLLF